jgi:hypothetical protein
MNLRRALAWAAFAVPSGALAACSATTDQPLFITKLQPPAPAAQGLCGAGTQLLASGVLDLSMASSGGSGYLLFPTAVNRMNDNMAQTGGVTTNNVMVMGSDVDLAFFPPLGTPLAPNEQSFRTPAYAFVPPRAEVTLPVHAIPSTIVGKIAASAQPDTTAMVQMRLVGTTSDYDVKSNTISFPVRLCKGCLVHNVGPCCAAAANPGLCNAQDVPVDCCSDNGGQTFTCPAQKNPTTVCP